MKLETVAIDIEGQKVLINKIDFDPDAHKRWSDEAVAKKVKRAKDETIVAETTDEAAERKPKRPKIEP